MRSTATLTASRQAWLQISPTRRASIISLAKLAESAAPINILIAMNRSVDPKRALLFHAGLLGADIFCSMGTLATVVYVATFCCSLLAWLVLLAGTGTCCKACTFGSPSVGVCRKTRLLSACKGMPLQHPGHASCWPRAESPCVVHCMLRLSAGLTWRMLLQALCTASVQQLASTTLGSHGGRSGSSSSSSWPASLLGCVYFSLYPLTCDSVIVGSVRSHTCEIANIHHSCLVPS